MMPTFETNVRMMSADHSPAIDGWEPRDPDFKAPPGTKGPCGRPPHILPSLTELRTFPNREPSHKWPGCFQANPLAHLQLADDCIGSFCAEH